MGPIELTDQVADMRGLLPLFEQAWTFGQDDPHEENPEHQPYYTAATSEAGLICSVIDRLLVDADARILLSGRDPNDIQGLADEVARGLHFAAVSFKIAAHRTKLTFRHWASEGDFAEILDAFETAGVAWLAERQALKRDDEGVSEFVSSKNAETVGAKAEAAKATMEVRGQRRGLTTHNSHSERTTAERNAEVWELLGNPTLADPKKCPEVWTAIENVSPDVLARLAKLYGKDSPKQFKTEALDSLSSLRRTLLRTVKAMR